MRPTRATTEQRQRAALDFLQDQEAGACAVALHLAITPNSARELLDGLVRRGVLQRTEVRFGPHRRLLLYKAAPITPATETTPAAPPQVGLHQGEPQASSPTVGA